MQNREKWKVESENKQQQDSIFLSPVFDNIYGTDFELDCVRALRVETQWSKVLKEGISLFLENSQPVEPWMPNMAMGHVSSVENYWRYVRSDWTEWSRKDGVVKRIVTPDAILRKQDRVCYFVIPSPLLTLQDLLVRAQNDYSIKNPPIASWLYSCFCAIVGIADVCDGLSVMFDHVGFDIYEMDVRPQNILLGKDGVFQDHIGAVESHGEGSNDQKRSKCVQG